MSRSLSETHPSLYRKEAFNDWKTDEDHFLTIDIQKFTLDKQVVKDAIADCQKTMNAIHPPNKFQIDVFVVGLIERLGLDKEE